MKRLLLLAAAALAAAGCSSTPDRPSGDPDWTAAEEAYLARRWPEAISRYDRFVSNNPGDSRVPEARLRIARAHLAGGQPARALPMFDAVLKDSPSRAIEADAHAGRGVAYHLLGSPAKAEEDLSAALSAGGGEVRRDECLWYLAVSRIRLGRWDAGLEDADRLLREYADSPYAARARGLRSQTAHHFAVQVGAFADPAGARRRADELKAAGYEPEIVPEGTLHCVRVGRYGTWREASAAADAVQARVGGETAVVP